MEEKQNILGLKFGYLTVIEKFPVQNIKGRKINAVLCKCDCGKEKIFNINYLMFGNHVKSCGCKKYSMSNQDLTGKAFYWLYVIGKGEPEIYRGSSLIRWLCRCVCGQKILTSATSLIRGQKKSCGCQNYQTTHGNRQKDAAEVSLKGLYNRMRNAAKHSKKDWSLTLEDIRTIINLNCCYCGAEPFEEYNVYLSKNGYHASTNITPQMLSGWIKYTGIDRVDSSIGYTIANTVPSCKWCNFAKNDMDVADFYKWIEKIDNFQKNKNEQTK